jgi:hypothetical protein
LSAAAKLLGYRLLRDRSRTSCRPRGGLACSRLASRRARHRALPGAQRPRQRAGEGCGDTTRANAPEATVTEGISRELRIQQTRLSELHIDRAYHSSELVRERSEDLEVYCKAWAVRNAGRHPKTDFALDWDRGVLRCPVGAEMDFEAGGVVRFPKKTCAACPLRERCTNSKSAGRSVSIHPDERLLGEVRERQKTSEGRAKLRERAGVEYSLAHIGHWQGGRARYVGVRKNLFDLRRSAMVHNLHVIARMPEEQRDAVAACLLYRLTG